MKNILLGGCAALALGIAGLSGASAGPVTMDSSLNSAVKAGAGATEVQFGGRGGARQWSGPRGRTYYRGARRGGGVGVGAGIAGLAAGAIIGGAIANSQRNTYYDDGYYAPRVYSPGVAAGDSVEYCLRRFKSYDPASGTYLGYDGLRHPCP